MECCTGEDLLETLEVLDVNLANLSPEVIKAWFDSDCPDTGVFLGWLCRLGRENAVSVNEMEEYEKMVRKNEALEGEQYLVALDYVTRTYPGILDVKGQAAEVEFMKDELALLLDEKRELENVVGAQERLNRKLCKSLASADNEHIASNINKRKAEEECLSLSRQLDDANAHLYSQLIKCGDKLREYENTEDPVYISLMSLDEYKDHYDSVLSDVNSLLRRKCNALPKLETARKSRRKLNKTIFELDNIAGHLSTLKYRTFHGIQNKNYKEMTRQKLLAELKYLKSVKLFDVIQSATDIRLEVESNVSLRSQHDRQSLELESAAKRASEGLCEALKLHFTYDETRMALAEFQKLSSVNASLSRMLSYQILACLMHVSNRKDLAEAETFFSATYHYVDGGLRECVLRTEAMQNKIDSYDATTEHSLLRAYRKVLAEYQDDESCGLHRLVSKFKNERNKSEAKLFSDDFEKQRENSMKLERPHRRMRRHAVRFIQIVPRREGHDQNTESVGFLDDENHERRFQARHRKQVVQVEEAALDVFPVRTEEGHVFHRRNRSGGAGGGEERNALLEMFFGAVVVVVVVIIIKNETHCFIQLYICNNNINKMMF